MSQRRSIASHLDSYIYISGSCVLFEKRVHEEILCYFSDNSMYSIVDYENLVTTLVKILISGPHKKSYVCSQMSTVIDDKNIIEKILLELIESEIVVESAIPNYSCMLHKLSDENYFRDISAKDTSSTEGCEYFNPNWARKPSERTFNRKALHLRDLKLLLFNCYGYQNTTSLVSSRPVPSAGGLYELELFVIVVNIIGLECGVYSYNPITDTLSLVNRNLGDIDGLFHTKHVKYSSSSFLVVITSTLTKYIYRYGNRGYRFALIEAGHVGQSLLMAAAEHSLASVPIGAHKEKDLAIQLNTKNAILYSLVFGMGSQ